MRLSVRVLKSAAIAALLTVVCTLPAWAQDGAVKPDAEPPPTPVEQEPAPEATPPAKPTADDEQPGATPADGEDAAPTGRRRRRPRLAPRLPKRTTTLDFTVGGWLVFFGGSSRKDTLNSIGTRIEFDEVDLEHLCLVVPVELQVHLTNRFTLLTDFFMQQASGSDTISTAITFDGSTMPAGTKVKADLDVISGSFAARYFASSSEKGTFEIEAGLRYLGAEIQYSAGGAKAVETTDAFIPFVGFHGTFHFWEWQKEPVGIEGGGRVGLLAIGDSSDNQTNAYLHAYIHLAVPLPFASAGRFRAKLTIGYDYVFLDAEREDNNADEDFEFLYHGPSFNIVLSF